MKACVAGYPIGHTLSPIIHGFWIEKYGIDNASYNAYEVKPDDLKSFLNALPKRGYYGCNLTIPLKEQAVNILANIDPFAKFIGAVNTVIISNGHFLGTNTDFIGFARNIIEQEPEFNFSKGKAVVLGAGGAARGVCFAIMSANCPELVIVNRSIDKAQAIADDFKNQFETSNVRAVAWDEMENELEDANLLVNTTSLGMIGSPELKIDLSNLPQDALVNDIVYNPLKTGLLEQAEQRGNKVVDGIGMLLHQAAPGFEAWFGIKPEVTKELRDLVLSKL